MRQRRLAGISTAALEAMKAQRIGKITALLGEVHDIELELDERRGDPGVVINERRVPRLVGS